MANLQRGVGQADTNFQQVDPVKGSNSGAMKAQLAGDLVKGALNVGSSLYANAKGKELSGADESAVDIQHDIGKADFDLDVFKNSQEGEIGTAELEDFRKKTFDEILSSEKRISAALKAKQISSTEANARLNVLRNEAMSNPFVALHGAQLDSQLFASSGGKVGNKPHFKATRDEREAAAKEKAIIEARAAYAKDVESVSQKFKMSNRQSEVYIQQKAQNADTALRYDQMQKTLAYTSKEAGARLAVANDDHGVELWNLTADYAASGGKAEDKAGLLLESQARTKDRKRAVRQAMFRINTDGSKTFVMSEEEASRQIKSLDKMQADFELTLKDQSKTQQFIEATAEVQARMDSQLKEIEYKWVKKNLVIAALPLQVQKHVLDNLNNLSVAARDWEKLTNPFLRSQLEFMDQINKEQGAEILSETMKTGNLPEGGENSLGAMADSDPRLILSDPNVGKHAEKLNLSIGQLNRGGYSDLLAEPGGVEIVENAIRGMAKRAMAFQRDMSSKSADGSFFGDRIEAGVPQTLKVTPIVRTAGSSNTLIPQRSVTQYSITTDAGVELSPQMKEAIRDTYKFFTANPTAWEGRFDSVDDAISAHFTSGGSIYTSANKDEAEAKEEEAKAQREEARAQEEANKGHREATKKMKERFNFSQNEGSQKVIESMAEFGDKLSVAKQMEAGMFSQKDFLEFQKLTREA